jgi:hypothetical protein
MGGFSVTEHRSISEPFFNIRLFFPIQQRTQKPHDNSNARPVGGVDPDLQPGSRGRDLDAAHAALFQPNPIRHHSACVGDYLLLNQEVTT